MRLESEPAEEWEQDDARVVDLRRVQRICAAAQHEACRRRYGGRGEEDCGQRDLKKERGRAGRL